MKQKKSMLELLAISSNHSLLRTLIEHGVEFNKLYKVYNVGLFKKITPLMMFAQVGDFEAVQILVEEAGVDVFTEITNEDGDRFNAVSFAKDHFEILEFLIELGCMPTGNSVGMISISSNPLEIITGYFKTIQGLIERRAKIEEALKKIEEPEIELTTSISSPQHSGDALTSDGMIDDGLALLENSEDLDELLIAYFSTNQRSYLQELQCYAEKRMILLYN